MRLNWLYHGKTIGKTWERNNNKKRKSTEKNRTHLILDWKWLSVSCVELDKPTKMLLIMGVTNGLTKLYCVTHALIASIYSIFFVYVFRFENRYRTCEIRHWSRHHRKRKHSDWSDSVNHFISKTKVVLEKAKKNCCVFVCRLMRHILFTYCDSFLLCFFSYIFISLSSFRIKHQPMDFQIHLL